MRKGLGFVCILLGILCLLASAGFVFHNRVEAETAGEVSQTLLQEVQKSIEQETVPQQSSAPVPEEAPKEMIAAPVAGHDCVGYLSIPVLGLELPVLTNWDYEKLQLAPCHYYGSCYDSNFVIAAHNYETHFGRLSELQSGDVILFTDMSAVVHGYEVVLLETLAPSATREMITSGFDLSLYTCTPGGANRVTVRCSALKSAKN